MTEPVAAFAQAPERRGAPTLLIRGVSCRRGERILFRDFDLTLVPGELVWLRAANGFGKTSLLRVVAGLAEPAAGSVTWAFDRPSTTHEPDAVLFLGHTNALKEDLTIRESLRHLDGLHALNASESAMDDAIRRFGLHRRRDAPVRSLSQGQRRRVALMRLCLAPARTTWLLDEPFDALDSQGVELVGSLLAAHAAQRGNVLFTSHVTPGVGCAPVRSVHLDAATAAA